MSAETYKHPFIDFAIEEALCTGCAVCVDSCPADVLRCSAGGKAAATYVEDCQACFLCVWDCPVEAISLKLKRLPATSIGPNGAL